MRPPHSRSRTSRPFRSFVVAALGLALLAPTGQAAAQGGGVAGYSMTFLQPTGTGSTTDSFDVWVRLSRDPSADPFTFDPTSPQTAWGLPSDIVPASYWDSATNDMVPYASYTNISPTLGYTCIGSFGGGCSGTPYSFNWGTAPDAATVFGLAPGDHVDFKFGTLVPVGSVAPGTYDLPLVWTLVDVFGTGPDGSDHDSMVYLAPTCGGFALTPGCGFTRTVGGAATVTPEPASLALVGTGVLALGVGAVRRRRS